MPALPSNKSNRRKGTKPITKKHPDHVLQRKLDSLGFELLSSPKSVNMEGESSTSPVADSRAEVRSLNILDLPVEALKEIFEHATNTDLIALSLVNKHFRDIAAEQLYRTFRIIFPDEGDASQDYSIDPLAGGLDTFVTSDYDYAQYLREIILEPLSGGEKGERAYRYYKYDVSCGKFLNTLLLLTLRKARILETFRWDIRVELSRDVMKALHRIDSIQHLHLRMQAGRSIYQAPPAVPANPPFSPGWSTASSSPVGPPPPLYNGPHAHHGNNVIIVPVSGFPPNPYSVSSAFTSTATSSSKSSTKSAKSVKTLLPAVQTKPPTLSGFKSLKSLAVLEMDTHDYINELKVCVMECSGTLQTLKISFSENLANKSRKPPPDPISSDESELEDEFGNPIIQTGPLPPNPAAGASDPNGPSKVIKALEEKKKQEAVLSRILGVETVPVKPKTVKQVKRPSPPGSEPLSRDPKRTFITNLLPLATKLMGYINTADGDAVGEEAQEILDIIGSAAKKYLESDKADKDAAVIKSKDDVTKEVAEEAKADGIVEAIHAEAGAVEDANDGPGLFDVSEVKKKALTAPGVADPDEIDMDEPQYPEVVDEAGEAEEDLDNSISDAQPEEAIDVAQESEAIFSKAESSREQDEFALNSKSEELQGVLDRAAVDSPIDWANRQHILSQTIKVATDSSQLSKDVHKLKHRWEELNAKKQHGILSSADFQAMADTRADLQRAVARVDEITQKISETDDRLDDLGWEERGRMSEYVRETRGLTLDTLAIYLIPLKASVLSRGVDLRVLQDITLLNVGPQIPFWNLMARENKISPLPLRKIYSDNVTLPFLVFISQLEAVTDLFLLERSAKARVESIAGKTTITVDQIRKFVLKKHIGSIKRLMIKHDSIDWDLNVKTVMLLCQRAHGLEELACSFSITTMHTFLQFITGLHSLRVLHTIQFRADDTCLNTFRDVRRFITDTISHHSHLKLEYLALDSSGGAVGIDQQVFRLVRRKNVPKALAKVDKKGKGKETATSDLNGTIGSIGSSIWGGLETQLPAGLDIDSSDDEEEMEGYKVKGLRLEMMGGLRFSDIAGVRIFEKDVVSGRL